MLKKKYKEMEVTIVEMNPAFEPVLEDIIKGSNVQLKMGDYTTLIDKGGPFDFIISTLPEQSLSASIVNKITDTMFKDLKEAGFLTRVRYVLKLRWIAPFFNTRDGIRFFIELWKDVFFFILRDMVSRSSTRRPEVCSIESTPMWHGTFCQTPS